MASETARIIDLQEYRRRRSPEPVALPTAAPVPSGMALVWVPVLPLFMPMPTTSPFPPISGM